MSLGRFVCQAVAAIALAAASSPGAVLLSETFQSGSPNLPSGWFSAVAVGSGVPFVQSPNLDGSAFGYLTGQSEVQLYTPILTTQGPYPLRLEFDIAGMSTFVIAMVVEVSINGGAEIPVVANSNYGAYDADPSDGSVNTYVFSGITGRGFTVTTRGNGVPDRFGIAGLQIVPNQVPEPASLAIAAFGGLAFMVRRRGAC